MEYKVDVGGVMYGMGNIQSVNISQPLFDSLSVGNACTAELNMTFWPTATVPRMARIVPYARRQASDNWQQLGIFYIDTRSKQGDALSIVAYDIMLRGEVIWEPRQDLEFEMTMPAAAAEIARLMGTTLDRRTVLNPAYKIDYPANDYTLRDVLCFIAGAHAGNWIVTAAGQLLLVPLFGSLPPETHYLIEEHGAAITFGGVRILV